MLAIQREKIESFCRKWRVTEFALFGSALREDFSPTSDVDVLATFAPDAHWTLFDMVAMREELQAIFGREVDLLTRRGVESSRNARRRESILGGAKVVFAA
jgi:predicted nucleotidyltransferase